MSAQYDIKWRIQDEKELRRVARNFNDKIRRIAKKSPELKNILPQFYNEATDQFESRITIQGLKSMIQTRQDYNRYINMLQRFSRRGAERIVEAPGNEYDTKITLWQKNEMARLASIVNRKRQERLDRLNIVQMMDASGKLGYTLGEMFGMGLASRNKLQPTKAFTRSQSRADINYKLRALQTESKTKYYLDRDQLLKNNYIKAILENYNEDDVKDILNAIRNMDADEFVLKFEARGDKFEMVYPPERGTEDYNNYVSDLWRYWVNGATLTR